MSSLHKTSVREEVDRLKTTFGQLSSKDKLSKECRLLFQGLFMVIELILSIFLEKQTKKTSLNSSKPSSQTDKDETAIADNKTNSKGIDEKITLAGNTRTVETTEIVCVTHCEHCDQDLTDIDCQCMERRTRIDIVFEKTLEHVDVEVKQCPRCQRMVKGRFPSDMLGPLQYGNGIKAYIVQLLVMQMLSLNRVSKMLATFIGRRLSEATLLRTLTRLHLLLEPWEFKVKQQLLSAQCINTDETSCRVDKKNGSIGIPGSWVISFNHQHY